MDGLHSRKKEKVEKEDEAEFLDEEEQEKLLQELRNQNIKANKTMQIGLLVIGCIVSALYFHILFQNGTPVIPISQIYNVPERSKLGSPRLAAFVCILSILASIFTFLNSSDLLKIFSKEDISIANSFKVTGSTAIGLGSVAPLMSLLHNTTTTLELIYWSIPLFLCGMYFAAYYMAAQVQNEIEQLEKAKYKYKGA